MEHLTKRKTQNIDKKGDMLFYVQHKFCTVSNSGKINTEHMNAINMYKLSCFWSSVSYLSKVVSVG